MKRNKTRMLLRWPQRLVRITGTILLGAYLASVVDPVMANVRVGEKAAQQRQTAELNATELLAKRLVALEELLQRMQRRLEGRFEFDWEEALANGRRTPPPPRALRADLASQERELAALTGDIAGLLPRSRSELEQFNAPGARFAPNEEMVLRASADRMSFEEGAARISHDLAAVRGATDEATFAVAVKSAHDWLRTHSSRRSAASFDPDKLAFGSRGEQVRPPALDRAELHQLIGTASEPFSGAAALAGKDAPQAGDLAPTEDVQLSSAIRAKAQELGASPLNLYRFVHDHVQFEPTFGSIQGADYTLQTLRGNAFDQASLLIALLRASNIPARYVYGTIEVPVAQVMNWVGGVTDPRAALSLLGQGGIPSIGIAQAGAIAQVRLEHVWVEVWSNQFPGGGVRGGSGDSWVALDPSFKRNEFTAGMDFSSAVPFNAQGFVDDLANSATSDESAGWIEAVDTNYIDTQMSAYRSRVDDYLKALPSGTTVGDVLGVQKIKAEQLRGLPTALPYRQVVAEAPLAALPAHLRWQFRFSIGQPSLYGDVDDETVLIERSLPSLAGKSLALGFSPATAADQDLLNSYLPASADNPGDIPLKFPANTARLVSEFIIDREAATRGPTFGLGTELITRKGFFTPGKGWDETENRFSVGDYQAIGLDLGTISQQQFDRHKAHSLSVKARLEARDASLTRHDLTGTVLYSGILDFFTDTRLAAYTLGKFANVVNYRLPSYGTVATNSRVSYLFGVPRLFAAAGVLVDVDRMAQTSVARDGKAQRRLDYERAVGGAMSANEHLTLEQMLSTQQESVAAVSASKILSLAAAGGQRVYRLDADNAAAVLPALNIDPELKSIAAEAVLAGKYVTTHSTAITHAGQTSSAVVILDPDTGGGGYLISGGSDGGSAECTTTLCSLGQAIGVLLLGLLGGILILIGFLLVFLLFMALVVIMCAIAETLVILGTIAAVAAMAALGFSGGFMIAVFGFLLAILKGSAALIVLFALVGLLYEAIQHILASWTKSLRVWRSRDPHLLELDRMLSYCA